MIHEPPGGREEGSECFSDLKLNARETHSPKSRHSTVSNWCVNTRTKPGREPWCATRHGSEGGPRCRWHFPKRMVQKVSSV